MKNDLISRQEAIDAVKKNTFRLTFAEEQNCEGHLAWSANAVYSDVIEGALLELPSAQPERKRGKWIIKDNPRTGWYRVTCSECGEDVTSTAPCIGFYPNAKVTFGYCPNCGADMREEDDE